MINPFMVAIVVLQFLAAVWEFFYGNRLMAAVYLCYSFASALLTYISFVLKK